MLETTQILLLGVSVESLKQNIGPSPPPHPYLYISKQNIYVEESVEHRNIKHLTPHSIDKCLIITLEWLLNYLIISQLHKFRKMA